MSFLHIKTSPMLAVSTNILLQCWLFLLLLKVVKKTPKLNVKKPTELERVHYLWQRPESFSFTIHFEMLRKYKSLYENTTNKKGNPSHKTNSYWGCSVRDLRMHRGLAQRVTGSAVHWDNAILVVHRKLLSGQQTGMGNLRGWLRHNHTSWYGT